MNEPVSPERLARLRAVNEPRGDHLSGLTADEVGELVAEVERLHTWDGLMSLLDRHYPADIFDGSSGDPGPCIIALTREIDRLRAQLAETGETREEFGVRWTDNHSETHDDAKADKAAAQQFVDVWRANLPDYAAVLICRTKAGEWREVGQESDRG